MSQLNVLLVEDNRLLRWCIACGLHQYGYNVVVAESVDEALKLNGNLSLDILVTDWRLGGGHDGFEVLQHIREKYPQVASILISAEADARLADQARSAGFNFIIEKPCPVAEIVGAVNALMGVALTPATS